MNDIEVLAKLNSNIVENYLKGNWQSNFATHSEVDHYVIACLNTITTDKQQIKRIFLESELGKRKKAHRPDYLKKLGL